MASIALIGDVRRAVPLFTTALALVLVPATSAMGKVGFGRNLSSIAPVAKKKVATVVPPKPDRITLAFRDPVIAQISNLYGLDMEPYPRSKNNFVLPPSTPVSFNMEILFRNVEEHFVATFSSDGKSTFYIAGRIGFDAGGGIYCNDRVVDKIETLESISKLLMALYIKKNSFCVSARNRGLIDKYISVGRADFLRQNSHIRLARRDSR